MVKAEKRKLKREQLISRIALLEKQEKRFPITLHALFYIYRIFLEKCEKIVEQIPAVNILRYYVRDSDITINYLKITYPTPCLIHTEGIDPEIINDLVYNDNKVQKISNHIDMLTQLDKARTIAISKLKGELLQWR